jgi:hypothetical protein
MFIFTDYSGTLPEDPELVGKVLELLQKLGKVFIITGRTKILLPEIVRINIDIEVIEEYGNPVFSGKIPDISPKQLHLFYAISEEKYIIYPGKFSYKMSNLINKYGEENFEVVEKIGDFTNILSRRNWRLLRSTQNIGYYNPKHKLYELFTRGKAQSVANENIALYIGNEEMDIPCLTMARQRIWVGAPVGTLPDGTSVVPSPEELYQFLRTIFTLGSA